MTRLPQITARELIQFLIRQGYVQDRQSGSHLTLWNEQQKKAVTVPVHPGDLGRGLVLRILKDAGFTADDYIANR